MPENRGTVVVAQKDDYLLTSFEPPIAGKKLFEATSSAFIIHEIVHDKKSPDLIRGIVYLAGDEASLKENLSTLRREVTAGTGYQMTDELKKLGTVATRSSALTEAS